MLARRNPGEKLRSAGPPATNRCSKDAEYELPQGPVPPSKRREATPTPHCVWAACLQSHGAEERPSRHETVKPLKGKPQGCRQDERGLASPANEARRRDPRYRCKSSLGRTVDVPTDFRLLARGVGSPNRSLETVAGTELPGQSIEGEKNPRKVLS